MGTAAKGSDGIAFLVAAGIVYEIIAAACSSPQTTEINAATRAGTLMKWVHIGAVQAVLFIAVAAYIDRRHAKAVIGGGGTAMALMYGSYFHAKQAGLKNGGPPTETYGSGSRAGGMKWA
jgi:hypothetical protein